MGARKRASLSPIPRWPLRPTLYTAQDVAGFCEVDLSTIHHWVGKERLVFHRTPGHHLRFRRNDVLRFLRAHDYPLPRALTEVRCPVSVAGADVDVGSLSVRFDVQQHASGAVGLASLFRGDPPDLLLIRLDDASLAGARTIAALTSDPTSRWLFVGAIGDAAACAEALDAGAAFARTDGGPDLVDDVSRVLAIADP